MFKKLVLTSMTIGTLLCDPVDYVNRDISIAPTISHSTSQRIYLISYADGEIYMRNQNYLMLSALNKGIDTLIAYRPEHIKKEFYEEHKSILEQGRGAGYWLWKPYFIVETLKVMNENDILIYVNSGAYFNENPIQPVIDVLDDPETSIILYKNYHRNRGHVKRDLFDIMEVDYSHLDDLQLEATYIIVKKTETSLKFMNQFLQYSCIEQAITDSPSETEEFPDFDDHRHDQAILSLLSIKEPKGIKKMSSYHKDHSMWLFHHHRRHDPTLSIIGYYGG